MILQTLIAVLILWITLVVLQSFIHHYLIVVLKRVPKYLLWFGLRGSVASTHGLLFSLMDVRQYIPILAYQLLSHVIIFAPLLNKLRGLDFFYLGKDSGWFDKLFYGNPQLYKVFYVSCCICFVIVNIVLFNIYL